MSSTRRYFIQKATLGVAGTLSIPFVGKAAFNKDDFKNIKNLRVGVAGYTFLNFDIDQSIAMMKRLDLQHELYFSQI